MTTVSELISDLGKFDSSLVVAGAEALTVEVVTQVPVVPVVQADQSAV